MKTKFTILLTSLIYVLSLGLIFWPQPVLADAAGTWLDAGTIVIGQDKYIDVKPLDNTRNFHKDGVQDGSCIDHIDVNSVTNGTLTTYTRSQTNENDCTKKTEPITLSNAKDADIVLNWVDAGQLEVVVSGVLFAQSKDTSTPNLFLETNDGTCHSSVNVKSDERGDLTLLGDLGGKCVKPNIAGANVLNNVHIGKPENRKIPAGQGAPSGASGVESTDNSCESKGGVLSWFLCPVIEMLDGIFNWVDTQIQGLLEVNRDAYTNPTLYKAWSNIRNIAYLILIPVMLVMVVGTAAGFEAMSAYTVKKALPRMVAAIFFISLSWYICAFFINLTNIIGSGVIGIMTSPFGLSGQITLGSLFNPGVGGAIVQGGTLAAVGFGIFLAANLAGGGLLGILLLYFLGAVLALFVGFLVLVIRQMFILALLLASPMAILAWIFPGNDKLWKAWWSTFSKLLLMFPLITALIGVGRVFAYLIGHGAVGSGGPQGSILNPLLKITAYVIPYLIIPLTFKFAGGAFATLTGMVNDRGRGAFDRLKKGRQKRWKELGHNWKHGTLFRNNDSAGRNSRWNEKAQRLAHLNKAGFRPSKWKSKLNTAVQDTERAEQADIAKDPEMANLDNYDDLELVAATANTEEGEKAGLLKADERRMTKAREAAREAALKRGATEDEADRQGEEAALAAQRYLNPEDLENDVARVERIRKKYSVRALRQYAAIKAIAGGTATDTAADALELVATAAGSSDAVLMNLLAEMRKAAVAGGRVDQGGASQGVTYNTTRELMADLAEANKEEDLDKRAVLIKAAKDKANKAIRKGVIDSQGASILLHPSMKPSSMEQLVPEIQDRIKEALASGDMARVDREMALVNTIHANLTQTSPQLAEIFAEKVMQYKFDTASEVPENLQGDGRDKLGSVINVNEPVRMIRPERQETRAAEYDEDTTDGSGFVHKKGTVRRDRTGKPIMETVTIPAEYEYAGYAREAITVQQILESRRGSETYNAFTKDYGATAEAQRRAAAGGATPGAAAGGGAATGAPTGP